ncbi:MAG: molybdopterin-binding protein [Hyphomicrobiales bacterium]|nr:molybdopterin-binding protein [Hyphomicrobiales bacterium]
MTDGVEQKTDIVTAAMLVIGDEILSGRTKDVNINAVAARCTAIGVRLMEARVVPDVRERIVEAVNALRPRYDYLFTSGGIGPTHDDITADCVAAAFGVGISVREDAVAMLRERYSAAELTPARLRMARIPHGAALIENPVSKAPGFMLGNVIVMAGVPGIMRAMLDAVTPRLRTGRVVLSETVVVARPEGEVAQTLAEAQARFPDVAMGSYPFFEDGRAGANLVLRGVDAGRLGEAAAALKRKLAEAGLAGG